MKKKRFFLVLSLLSVFVLTGCAISSTSKNSNTQVSSGGSNENSSSLNGDNYYKATSYSMHNRDVNADDEMKSMPHLGQQKLLVVPVQLRNGTSYTSSMLTRLTDAFFGDSSSTSWHSVASYYQQSSYGKLTITGEVTPVLTSSYSVSTLRNDEDPAGKIANEYYASASSSLLQSYDQDDDGYVDGIIFIYSNTYDGENFWAWVDWLNPSPNTNKPTINVHMWASYAFMDEGYGSSGIDAHTYIHEQGHMLGLDDYYPSDARNNYNAAGQLDMMDSNVLDHSVYSKMAMEWTYPYVVTGSTSITLRPFESSGDCIIINDSWNGSALDEYIAIEFYTPTGLNKKDSDDAYPANDVQGYTIPGIKIYHIDSRVVKLSSSGKFESYVSMISSYDDGHYAVGAANSNQWSETDTTVGTYKLVHLMEATGTNSFKEGGIATNATLFTAGTGFTPSSAFFPKGANFNNNSRVGYSITVASLSSTSATISITKI